MQFQTTARKYKWNEMSKERLENLVEKEKIRKERLFISMTSKRRYTKLFSPKLPDCSRLIIRIVRDVRDCTFLLTLKAIY